jgi:hypothetical protein
MRVNSMESMMWPRISRVSVWESMAPRCGSLMADRRLSHGPA